MGRLGELVKGCYRAVDANGILNVSALDKATHRAQHITITAASGLSKEEAEPIKRKVQELQDALMKLGQGMEMRLSGG